MKENKFKIITKIIKIILKGNWGILAVILAAYAVMTGIAPFIVPYISRNIFDALDNNDIQKALITCLISFVYIMIYSILYYFITIYPDAWMTKVTNKGMVNLFKEYSNLPYFEICSNFSSGDIRNRINTVCQSVIITFLLPIQIMASIFSLVYLVVLAINITWLIPVIILVIFFINFAVLKIQYKKNSNYIKKENELAGKHDNQIKKIAVNAEFLVMNNLYDTFRKEYFDIKDDIFDVGKKKMFIGFLSFVPTFFSELGKMFYLHNVMKKRKSDIISAGQISSSISIYDNLRNGVVQIKEQIGSFPNISVPFLRFNEIYSIERKIKNNIQNSNKTVKIENLTFSIGEKNILNNINIEINKNEKVALIGENGCGKSTLLRLIAGLYQAQEGYIKINNADIENVKDNAERRNMITYIPKEDQIFIGSIDDNIIYNSSDKEEKRLSTLQRDINIDSFKNLNTDEMSGGQKKRINIARALIHSSEILLADEPTSSLDYENSKNIIHKILNYNGTCIIVTHDKDQIKYFDRIIMLKNGEKVLDGKYNEIKETEYFKNWEFCI